MAKFWEWWQQDRPFIGSSIVWIVATYLLVSNHIQQETWKDLTVWCLGIYTGHNVLYAYIAKKLEQQI